MPHSLSALRGAFSPASALRIGVAFVASTLMTLAVALPLALQAQGPEITADTAPEADGSAGEGGAGFEAGDETGKDLTPVDPPEVEAGGPPSAVDDTTVVVGTSTEPGPPSTPDTAASDVPPPTGSAASPPVTSPEVNGSGSVETAPSQPPAGVDDAPGVETDPDPSRTGENTEAESGDDPGEPADDRRLKPGERAAVVTLGSPPAPSPAPGEDAGSEATTAPGETREPAGGAGDPGNVDGVGSPDAAAVPPAGGAAVPEPAKPPVIGPLQVRPSAGGVPALLTGAELEGEVVVTPQLEDGVEVSFELDGELIGTGRAIAIDTAAIGSGSHAVRTVSSTATGLTNERTAVFTTGTGN